MSQNDQDNRGELIDYSMQPITVDELQGAVKELVIRTSVNFSDEIQLFECDGEHKYPLNEIVKETCLSYSKYMSGNTESLCTVAHTKLLECIKHRSRKVLFPIFLTTDERNHLKSTFIIVKSLMDWNFSYVEFYKSVCTEHYMPLELIWKLHEYGIMPMEIFVKSIMDQPQTVAAFSRSIIILCSSEFPNENDRCSVISGILSYLVTCSFDTVDINGKVRDPTVGKVCCIILDRIIKKIITTEEMKLEKPKIPSIIVLWHSPTLEKHIINSFSSYVLKFILGHNPSIKVSQAISEQHKWTFKTANKSFVALIEKVLVILEPQDVSSALFRALEAQEVNWKSLLIVASTYLICWKEASTSLLNIIDKLLKEAFNKLESDNLFSGFLLARQASLEGPPLFPYSYGGWFENCFGTASTTYANNVRTFSFLMKFLTDLVPHEPTQYLKIHLSKPPYIVNRCRSIFTDYTFLVKTRLSDLKEPLTQFGMLDIKGEELKKSKFGTKAQKASEKALAEVERVLQSFESTGKIPSTVLEASIFRKPYFIGQFLPALLIPRLLPDLPDIKMKFIDALKRVSKIPQNLIEEYEKACSKETDKLLEGIILDDSFEEEFQEPEENLQKLLQCFQQQIDIGGKNEEDQFSLCTSIIQFCGKLQSVLKQIIKEDHTSEDLIILTENAANCTEQKIVEMIIESYCSFQYSIKEKDCSVAVSWDLASLLLPFSALHKPLYKTIWEKLVNSNTNSEDSSLYGLSLCLLKIGMTYLQYLPVVRNSNNYEPELLPEAVFDSLTITNSHQMHYFLRLAYLYLRWASWTSANNNQKSKEDITIPTFIPLCLMKKFQFLAMRMLPSVRKISIQTKDIAGWEDSILKLYKSETVQKWISACQLSLPEWLEYEADILPDTDHFGAQERSDYLQWCIHCHFLLHSNLIGNCNGSVYKASSTCFFRVLVSKLGPFPSFSQLIILLQELVAAFFPCRLQDNSLPWLLQQFCAVINSENECKNIPISIHYALKSFFRVACSLPPFLLFGDTLYETNYSIALNEMKNIINNWLRLYITEVGFLTSNITCHIIKGLIQTFFTSKKDELLKSFIWDCPLLLSSVVVHWPSLQPLLMSMVISPESYLNTLLNEIRLSITWVSCITSGSEMPKPLSLSVCKKWVLGLALTMQLSISKQSIPCSQVLDNQILAYAVQFQIALEIVSYISVQDHGAYPSLVAIGNVRMLCLQKNGYLLNPKNYGHSVLKDILAPSVWQLFPAGCLRALLAAFKREDLQQSDVEVISTWLSLLLTNLKECSKQFDNAADNDSIVQIKDVTPKKTLEILDLNFLQDSTQIVKQIISVTPLVCLKEIPQDVIQDCEEEMQLYIYQKIGKRMKMK